MCAGAGVCEGVCRRALACGSERGACLYLARALSFPDAGAGPESVLAGSSACLLAPVERMEELEDLRESAAEKEKKGE